ncbi:MAG TPA: hypothetical protein VN429_09635, partial [Methanospirillum sp.]|uniref:hypothetical protein n=1 Tax=Methanospirillum sp. TaxID=45200 RepID=UPI002C3B3FCE
FTYFLQNHFLPSSMNEKHDILLTLPQTSKFSPVILFYLIDVVAPSPPLVWIRPLVIGVYNNHFENAVCFSRVKKEGWSGL